MARHNGLTRRAALALLLAGCARMTHGALPDGFGTPVTAPYRLRIVIFELARADIPFHTGLIIHTPDETLVYDPAGTWVPSDASCQRAGEVIHDVTPAMERAYLARDGIRYARDGWTVHVFERAVSPEVARLARDRAMTPDLVPPLHCAHRVSSLLAGLPGFDDVQPGRLTTDLLNTLLARDDLTYTRTDPRTAQSG